MQVGISQIIMSKTPVGEFLTQSASAGYEVVELLMSKDGDLTLQSGDADFKRITTQANDAGVKLVSMCQSQCTGNLLDSGEAQKISIEQTRRGLHAAAALGIDCTLHTLGRLNANLYYDDAWRNAIDSLKQIAKTCDETGVDLAVEFVWNGFLFSPLEMKRLLDEVGHPRIGFYFDPGNMAVFQFPHHWVRILGRHIKRVHLKDWKGNALNGGWPALLDGAVDFATMNRELRSAASYDGPMISEVPPNVAPIDATARAIRKIIAM